MTDPSGRGITLEQWNEIERTRLRRTRWALGSLLVILVLLLAAASVALVALSQPPGRPARATDATGMTWVRSIYGWGNTKAEQLQGPQGVAIGPDGVIWATDQGYCRVIGFNPDGSYAGMMYLGMRNDPRSPNAMQYPTSVAVDSDNRIYIGDQAGNNVYIMTRDNKLVRRLFVPTPQSVAVSDDRLVVGAASGFVIMSKAGDPLKVVGKQGKADGEFMGVRGVALGKDGSIYVVDQYNNRISSYDRNGVRKWIKVMGAAGNQKPVASTMNATSTAALQLPAQIAIDSAGRLTVVDPFGFNIAVLDAKDGKIVARYGDAGTNDGQFTYPSGIAYDPARDWFAVADTMNQRVEIVRLPDSGGSLQSAVVRNLSGSLRACLLPLLLLLIAIIVGLQWRVANRRRQSRRQTDADFADAGDSEEPTSRE
jgi:sugar lactone lactonase YvrE